MNDEYAKSIEAVLPFECDGCGQCFESWDRLRQHQIDCRSDIDDGAL
jgi:hypothetical protein